MNNNDFTNRLQKDIKAKKTRDEIIKRIEDNPEIIDTLSLERLNQLISMQDELIHELDVEIDMMKRKIKNLNSSSNSN